MLYDRNEIDFTFEAVSRNSCSYLPSALWSQLCGRRHWLFWSVWVAWLTTCVWWRTSNNVHSRTVGSSSEIPKTVSRGVCVCLCAVSECQQWHGYKDDHQVRSPSHHQRLVCLLRRQPGSSRGFPLFGLAGLPNRGQLAEIPAWSCRAAGVGQRLVVSLVRRWSG